MFSKYRRVAILLSLIATQILTIETVFGGTATIAVASNFLAPAKALAIQFEKQSGHKIRISAGSTGKLYAQIIHGAPYDAFFAANDREPKRLEKEGMTITGSRFTYALGQLVLWSKEEGMFSDYSPQRFEKQQFKSIAIANPRTAPYGFAATELLKKYRGAKPGFRIIRGENVGQAFQYARTGNTQAGFVAMSQVLTIKAKNRGSYWLVPASEYTPIKQQAVLLKRAKDNAAVIAFMKFIQSAAVQHQLVSEYGYATDASKDIAVVM